MEDNVQTIKMHSSDTIEGSDVVDLYPTDLNILTLILRKFRKHIPDFEDLSKFSKGTHFSRDLIQISFHQENLVQIKV